MAVGQNQWYHFGIGAPPILVYFSGDWDVHWGYRMLTRGHMSEGLHQRKLGLPVGFPLKRENGEPKKKRTCKWRDGQSEFPCCCLGLPSSRLRAPETEKKKNKKESQLGEEATMQLLPQISVRPLNGCQTVLWESDHFGDTIYGPMIHTTKNVGGGRSHPCGHGSKSSAPSEHPIQSPLK